MNGMTNNGRSFAHSSAGRFAAFVAAFPAGLDVPLFDLYGAGFQRPSKARIEFIASAMRKITLDSPEERIARAWQDVGANLRNAIRLYEDGHRNSAQRVNASV
jgi:hypothetical protein